MKLRKRGRSLPTSSVYEKGRRELSGNEYTALLDCKDSL